MCILFSLCFSLSSLFGGGSKAPQPFSHYVQGNWTIQQENKETNETTTYKLDLFPTESYLLQGALMGEDEDGLPVPIGYFSIANATETLEEDLVNKYTLLYGPSPEEQSELTTISAPALQSVPFKYTGQIEDTIFSLYFYVEWADLELYNTKTKEITTYYLSKYMPPQQGQNMMMSMLPMLLMMMFSNMARPQQQRK